MTPEEWRERLLAMRDERADAYFLSCTNIRALPVIETLEAELGAPVISSNQAMLWRALLGVALLLVAHTSTSSLPARTLQRTAPCFRELMRNGSSSPRGPLLSRRSALLHLPSRSVPSLLPSLLRDSHPLREPSPPPRQPTNRNTQWAFRTDLKSLAQKGEVERG